jgi:large subunit ribosomal protein L38
MTIHLRFYCGSSKSLYTFKCAGMTRFFISRANINLEKKSDEKELFSYLPPFPMKGTGWHRCAFILYEHEEPVDYGNYFIQDKNEHELDLRKFKTIDFYLKHQEKITPVSYLFFQTQWDESVRKTFHDKLSKFKSFFYNLQFQHLNCF